MSLMDAVRKSDDPGLMINTNISVIENKIVMSYKIKHFQEWKQLYKINLVSSTYAI